MNGIADQIARRASETNTGEIAWDGCLWAEQIPRFHRGETDSEANLRIQRHLEGCEECNTLLVALAVQTPPETGFAWVARGARQVLDRVVGLGGGMAAWGAGTPVPQPAMRGDGDADAGPGAPVRKIPLPDGSELHLSVVGVPSQKRILTATMADGARRRYDLYGRGGDILKSIDDARQVKIVLPDSGVVLIVDDRFEINLGDDLDIPPNTIH